MDAQTRPTTRERVLQIVGTLVVAAGIAVALWSVRPGQLPIHHDTNRDLALAQRALESGDGPLVGPPTSLAGIYQGAFWTVHVASVLGLGGDLDTVAGLTWLGICLAVLAIVVSGALLGEWLAGIGAALLLAIVLVVARESWAVQWNPSLMPLPAALVLLFALEAIRFRSPLAMLLAAIAAALAAQLHPTAWLLLPILAWVFWYDARLADRSPVWWGVLAGVVLVPFGLFGTGALALNIGQLGSGQTPPLLALEHHLATHWWCLATVTAALFHGFAASFRAAYARPLHRATALFAGLPAALFLIALVVLGGRPAPRHLLPFIPAAALVLASIPANILTLFRAPGQLRYARWLMPLLAATGLLVATVTRHPPGVTHTYDEANWVATQLTDDGLCEPSVVAASLHAQHSWALLAAVLAWQVGHTPCFRKDATPRLVAVLPASHPNLPDGWRTFAGPNRTLALIPQPSILGWDRFTWRGPEQADWKAGSHRLDRALSTPGYPEFEGFGRSGMPGCLDIVLPVDIPAGRRATLVLLKQAPLGGTTESILGVKNLTVEGRGEGWLTATRANGSAGEVTLQWCIDHPVPQEVLRGLPPVAVGLDDDGLLLKDLLVEEASP